MRDLGHLLAKLELIDMDNQDGLVSIGRDCALACVVFLPGRLGGEETEAGRIARSQPTRFPQSRVAIPRNEVEK